MINYTTLLKLAQPQPGTEDGSWGTTVNDALTSPLDIAVGGSATIDVTSGNVVLTNGDGSASNQARYAVLRITGTPGTTRNVEAPGGSTSRNWYIVRNESNGSVVIKENATTGVTIPAGKTAVVMWSGSDYVIATVAGASASTDNAVARFDGLSGQLIQNSAVLIADTTGDITGGKYNGLTITTSTGTLTVANGKTLTASNTLTLTGTDGTTAAFGAGLTIAAGKTFGVNNSLTLAGTDSTTMTFPGTNATIARTDAAQTFTGIQTFSSAPVMSALTVSKPVFTSAGGALTSSGTLLTDQGGTGQTTYTAGDMVYYATGTAMTKLGIGTPNYVLTSSGSAPQWSAPASVVIGTATNIQGGAAGSVPYQSGASTTTFLGIGSAAQVLQVNSSGTAPEWVSSTGTGSVVRATSPTLVDPALGTPSTINLANATNLPLGTITGLGTGVATALAINVGSAGAFVPTTGSGASGTWTISINGNANTATTATTASTATNIASGGTNQVVYQSSSGSTSFTPSPSSGNLYLKWTGSAFTWDAPSGSGDVSGPASSTADGLVAFDGTSGKIIKAAGTVTVAQGGTGLTAFGSALQVLRVNASATALEYATVVTSPAGSNTQVQFNDNGVFGGDAGLVYDKSTDTLTGVNVNATTIDTTNIEVTNIKAKDGTAAASIADSTGAITVSTLLNVDNLRLDGNTLSSTDSNGNIVLAPNGTGDVQLDADTVRIGDSSAAATLTTNGTGNLTISTNSGTNSGTIVINQGANANIEVAPNGTGGVYLTADTVRIGDSNANATLTTNGAGDLILSTNSGTNSGTITIQDGVNGNIILTPNGTGAVQETVSSTNYNIVSQSDIGTAPNEIPLNQYLGSMAYQDGDTSDITVYGVRVGRGAGGVSTNTAVGASALAANTTGARNTAFGSTALTAVTSGSWNIGIGSQSLQTLQTGDFNIAVGGLALATANGASFNVAMGQTALTSNTTGSNNTGLGYDALRSNTTASNNTAVGYQAGYSNTTGDVNVFMGRQAGYGNTTGAANNAFGDLAMYTNSTGASNNAFGRQALYSNTTGNYNTALGHTALYNNTTTSNNTAVGYQALYNSTGADNTSLGYQAGDVITTGTGNVIIGKGADPSVNSATDQIVIGNGVTGQANTNVTIGNGTGKIYNAYTVNATWTQTSDGTMKDVIGPDSLGLSFINRLNPILFTWKAQNDLPPDHPYYAEENKRDTTRVIHGFVAQEVKAALDAEGCSTFNGWDQGDDGIQAISREMFISPLVKAVQELSAQVEQLKAELAALKGA